MYLIKLIDNYTGQQMQKQIINDNQKLNRNAEI